MATGIEVMGVGNIHAAIETVKGIIQKLKLNFRASHIPTWLVMAHLKFVRFRFKDFISRYITKVYSDA